MLLKRDEIPRVSGRAAVALVFGVLLVVILLIPNPSDGRLHGVIMDLGHSPAFALMSLVAIRAANRTLAVSSAIAGLIFIGSVFVEFLQEFVGRQASWHDVWGNFMGVTAGFAACELIRRGKPRYFLVVPILVVIVGSWEPLCEFSDILLQRWQRPLIGSFEFAIEMRRWKVKEGAVQIATGCATHGSKSLRADLQAGQYPGVTLRWPFRDWSHYQSLHLDVHLNEGPPLDLVIKIHDAQHNQEENDRFHQQETLNPGWNRLIVSLRDVEAAPESRRMDMRNISIMQLFSVNLPAARTLHLDHLRLAE